MATSKDVFSLYFEKDSCIQVEIGQTDASSDFAELIVRAMRRIKWKGKFAKWQKKALKAWTLGGYGAARDVLRDVSVRHQREYAEEMQRRGVFIPRNESDGRKTSEHIFDYDSLSDFPLVGAIGQEIMDELPKTQRMGHFPFNDFMLYPGLRDPCGMYIGFSSLLLLAYFRRPPGSAGEAVAV